MQRDGREQERGTIPFAGQALGLALARMQVRQQLVQHHEERHADGESTAAGIHPTCPASSARSMAGISNDHTDAAIITPAANPRNIR